jgi:Lon protease-like protein
MAGNGCHGQSNHFGIIKVASGDKKISRKVRESLRKFLAEFGCCGKRL